MGLWYGYCNYLIVGSLYIVIVYITLISLISVFKLNYSPDVEKTDFNSQSYQYRLLRIPVKNFQDAREVTWHFLLCTGAQLWRSTGQSRNDWVWVDSGNRNIYGALKGFYPAHLVSIMKVRELTTGSVDRLVFVDRLYVENSGKITNITGLVTVTLGTAKGPKATTETIVSIKRIMGMAYLVPETAERDNKHCYVNCRIDLETFNKIY